MVNESYRKAPYEKLQFYQNIVIIRKKVYELTKPFERFHPRLVNQMRDAARSAKQNIIEGYQKDSIGVFINSVKISKGSLGELLGDLEDCFEDKLISKIDFEELSDLISKTDYMMSRYIDSLYKMKVNGTWKTRFKSNQF